MRSARNSFVAAATAALAALGSGCAPGPEAAGPPIAARLTSPGFPPTAAEATARLAQLTTARGRNWESYRREEFGRTWSDETDAPGGRNGCDTRDDVLRRDLTAARTGDRNPCVVLAGTLHDPYTGATHPYSYRRASQIETDHVVALAAAWRAGAYAWTPQRRLTYANDLDVLLAVDKQANQDKGSRTPDKWRPPRRAFWCEYARRWTGIKAKYGLTVTPEERQALSGMLAGCPQ
ncbi:HNH endonuclease family protein [Streptomyces bambusae]|uniref:HNH endonuclease family protein n=1 Tax=Streptomyces bambusae TaxID=1550616 RepID=UPI001CFE298C|nr:HNH endonuclease family protein [Streptomyces bambusae]MCB5165325.1 HNH endonuclease family protein [Streptomyces bambusae]